MAEHTFGRGVISNRLDGALLLLAAIYLAVLPMANTIALRNIALLSILLLLLFRLRGDMVAWGQLFRRGSVAPIVLWGAFVCLFPIVAENGSDAWRSLGTIWSHSLLALLAGAGLAWAVSGRCKWVTPCHFALVTLVPIFIHLGLVAVKGIQISSIPWGYWGRETHHADLGYAAGHAVAFLGVALVGHKTRRRVLTGLLIVAALASVTVARSRAGLGFALLALFLVFVAHVVASRGKRRIRELAILFAIFVCAAILTAFTMRTDVRWVRMVDRISAGFHGDALQIQCEGNAEVEQELRKKFGTGERAADLVDGIRDGDGARVVLLRAGLQLALEHPWGLDGSRQAYQRRLREYCPNPKAFQLAHTHNGWLDTVLALGWIGAALYFLVLTNFLRLGITGLRAGGEGMEWAYVLVVLSTFWILRGFTDSVYRDHQLEMQGFVLAYAAVALKLKNRPTVPAAASGAA